MADFFEAQMADLNQEFSLSTAFKTWKEQWHYPNLEIDGYKDMYSDCVHVVFNWAGAPWGPDGAKDLESLEVAEEIMTRLFYILSTSPKETIPLATVASKLEADCPKIGTDYEEGMQLYSELVYELKNLKIYEYSVTQTGTPILIPKIKVQGELRTLLDNKFGSPLPQIGEVTGQASRTGFGMLPGIYFSGKSSKRKTPLNDMDYKAITLVSQQAYRVDIDIVNNMEYYVPTLTDDGVPISEREQEDARTAYYRFEAAAKLADEQDTCIQFPTTEDSRGRFYNAATDPAVRLSLRSLYFEGSLTHFEYELLENS